MEYLILTIALLLFVGVVIGMETIRAKREERKFIEGLYHNYLKLSEKTYSADRFGKMDSYFRRHSTMSQLDDITWNDLGMDQLFKRMNYTLSASGEEYLYYRLRTPYQNEEALGYFESVVEYFGNNPDLRVKLQYCMKNLGHTGKYSIYDYIDNLDNLGIRSNGRHIFADVLLLACIPLLWVNFTIGIVGLVGIMLYNIVSYFKDKGEIQPYIISFAYILRLLDVCEKIQGMEITACPREVQGIRESLKDLQGMRRNTYWVMFDSKTSTSSGDIISALVDYVKMVFHVDIIKFNQMLSHLRGHVEQVDSLIRHVGYLETAIAVWIFRESLSNGWCRPEFVKDEKKNQLIMKEGYHPMLEVPVKNTIETEAGVLLTGSNASGKSTFLKTVAINAVLAQSINTCAADSYRTSFYSIYTSMALRDDIQGGDSYYIVEIKALKRILDHAAEGERVLCIVDEVLRGTNTVERIAASTQILRSLGGKGILCFAATHDIELTELLEEQFQNYHFEEEIVEGDVRFHYRLLEGKATTRNAIMLLQLLGYDASIIESAQSQAKLFLETGGWKA